MLIIVIIACSKVKSEIVQVVIGRRVKGKDARRRSVEVQCNKNTIKYQYIFNNIFNGVVSDPRSVETCEDRCADPPIDPYDLSIRTAIERKMGTSSLRWSAPFKATNPLSSEWIPLSEPLLSHARDTWRSSARETLDTDSSWCLDVPVTNQRDTSTRRGRLRTKQQGATMTT